MEAEPRSDEQIEYEVRRVAAAFRITSWEIQNWGHLWMIKGVGEAGAWVNYGVNVMTGHWVGVRVGNTLGKECELYEKVPTIWMCSPHPQFNELMVRGLYCLGFQDQNVLSQLNHPLTTHEQMELRLAMPHEFWPTEWIEETKEG